MLINLTSDECLMLSTLLDMAAESVEPKNDDIAHIVTNMATGFKQAAAQMIHKEREEHEPTIDMQFSESDLVMLSAGLHTLIQRIKARSLTKGKMPTSKDLDYMLRISDLGERIVAASPILSQLEEEATKEDERNAKT